MAAADTSEERGAGWLEFAAVVMFAVGFFRIITAIGYFSNSHKINDLSNGLFSSHLWAWGVWDLLIAAAAFFGGLSILAGGGFGRVVGYIWAVLVIVQAFTVIGIVPWGAALAITLGILVIYALSSNPRAASDMSKMTWIIVLVVVGIALAVVVGVLGTRNEPSTSSSSSSKTEAVTQLCTSVKNLSTTLQGLANIDPSTITSTEIQTDITSVENAWNQVQTSAAAVQDAPTGDLTTAWNGARLGGHRRPERIVGQRRGVIRQDRRRGRRHGCEVDGVAALGLHVVLTKE